ncbi:MAG: helicase-related protein [Bacillota bacterium]
MYLSSETKDKKIVINQVLNTDYLVLLSTTLLERGVTFSKINVFVFETDHKIFTKEVLIQIAGRVGRDSLYPYGDIIFFSKFKTKAMLATLAQIKKLNKEKNNAL